MNIPFLKKCNRCKQELETSCFHKNKAFPDGLAHYCKPCRNQYYKDSPSAQAYNKKYPIEQREKRRATVRKSYEKNKIKISNRRRERYRLNKEKHALKERKRRENIQYKIKSNVSRRIRSYFKKWKFNLKTTDILGCSAEFFKNYIESKFKDGMSWNNYGMYGWHLDHIKPCVCFDLTDEKQLRECFHYSNFQPLWASENISKGSQFPYS